MFSKLNYLGRKITFTEKKKVSFRQFGWFNYIFLGRQNHKCKIMKMGVLVIMNICYLQIYFSVIHKWRTVNILLIICFKVFNDNYMSLKQDYSWNR